MANQKRKASGGRGTRSRSGGGTDQRLSVQYLVADALAEARSAEEAAPQILRAVCEAAGWSFAALWRADEEAGVLRCAAVWQAPGVHPSEWERLTRRSVFARGSGLPGRVWRSGEPAWTPDVIGEVAFLRARAAANAGTRSAFAFPAIDHGRVVAVIETLSPESREPAPELVEMLSAVGHQIGQALARGAAERESRASGARTSALLDAALECVIAIDHAGTITEWNHAAERTFGYSRQEALGRSMHTLIMPPALRSRHLQGLAHFRDTGEGRLLGKRVETLALRADGTEFPVELSIAAVEEPGARGAVGYLRDLSRRNEAEQALRLRDRAIAATNNSLVITDALLCGNPIVFVNPAFERMTGYSALEAAGQNPRFLQGPETDPAAAAAVASAIEQERETKITLINYRKDGSSFWNELSISPLRDDAGRVTHWVGVQNDVTERREAEEQIAFLAYHDQLTGLPNRAMFHEHLDLALARAARYGHAVAVLFIDVDRFKLVNDSFGHSVGDDLLAEIAQRLRAVTRAMDLVARQGGDEFLVLIPDMHLLAPGEAAPDGQHRGPLEVAEGIAENIREALRSPVVLAGTEVDVDVSIGISVYPIDAEDRDTLLKRADMAMYRAKTLGRTSAHTYGDDVVDARSHLSLTARLKKAVDRGEMVLHYQPVVELASGRIVSAEALIRWRDRERGLVPPLEFIPLAERIGLIGPISEWVLHEVCRQLAEWTRRGLGLGVAFNMPIVLWKSTMVEKVLDTAAAFGIDPQRLMIEITESAVMAERDVEEVLAALHEHGLKLAIDDFGTGYSSLSRLKQMPVTTLKIDRSFVGDVPADPNASSIVTTIVQLARSLGVQPLAEGIETPEQCSFLMEHGCELGQGYHFSPPVPAGDLEVLCRA